ncbi:hypothetical protein D9615_002875 [Tricholomella constricta]|uniref:Uncharacterized protein n=1 Tax=Tricholomella constricta TaxID=117010 RepID=A0A8H5HFT3_9AGAR|nr:hypothetical protein D9615_002875 [Tricholomella constricta]
MFSKIFTSLLLVSALIAGTVSKPIPKNRLDLSRRTNLHSFDHWGGFSSLNHFDNFYGVGNFDGSRHFSQTIVHEQQLVCHTERVEIIQQRLVVLQEMAKRIITQQICDVETQTIVFEQWHSSLGGFSHDLRRTSGHHVGFDRGIASHFGSIVHADGSLSVDDFGFTGHDIGSQTVVVGGSNWVDSISPVSVSNAYSAAHDAYVSLHPEYSSSISPSVVAPQVAPPDVIPSTAVPPTVVASDVAPSDIAPSDAVPSAAAPSDAVPSAAAPSDAVPSAAAPSAAVPSAAAPSDAVPSAAAPSAAVPSAAASDASTPDSAGNASTDNNSA